MATENAQAAGGISSEAVKAKTGKDWAEWFSILDAEGAVHLVHKDIAALVNEKYGVPGWWAQSVTVEYERARGLREKYQTPDGYQTSGSKTVNVPLAKLYAAWADEGLRSQWLQDPINVTKMTENKSLRAVAPDGRSRISVGFYAKGDAKSQVSLQHEKLTGPDDVAQAKAYWSSALDRLKRMLEQ